MVFKRNIFIIYCCSFNTSLKIRILLLRFAASTVAVVTTRTVVSVVEDMDFVAAAAAIT